MLIGRNDYDCATDSQVFLGVADFHVDAVVLRKYTSVQPDVTQSSWNQTQQLVPI